MKIKNQPILISGLPPSSGGVGRLMKNLMPLASNNGFSVVTRREPLSLRVLLNKNRLAAFVRELVLRTYDSLAFFLKIYFLKNKTVLFIHPQTVGINLLNRLIPRNKVYLYIMDNSFFLYPIVQYPPNFEK